MNIEKDFNNSDVALPDGLDYQQYIKKDQEWPNLEKRLGIPRIGNHFFFPELKRKIEQNKLKPENLAYFEAGCGFGTDLRVMRKLLDANGFSNVVTQGVDYSEAEIRRGLEFFQKQGNEDPDRSAKWFAQGDLRDLSKVGFYNEDTKQYDLVGKVAEGKFGIVYLEAVLHALGYGQNSYQKKKESAQKVLNELFRICQPKGTFFGRASTFEAGYPQEAIAQRLLDEGQWRFRPEAKEFAAMLAAAGFVDLKILIQPHEKQGIKPEKKNICRLSFVAQKPE